MSIQLQDFEEFQGKDAERELKIIKNCLDYAKGDPGGLPGHQLMLIVAKLHRMLTEPSDRYLSRAVLEAVDNYSQEWDGDLDHLQFTLKEFIEYLER